MSEEACRSMLETFATLLPMKRVGHVAKAVLYLMDNDFTTGAFLDVDGGQR